MVVLQQLRLEFLASIGIAEAIHAAARGENITVIFVNNCIYGMTGGQMAPTSLIGQKTATTPFGRDAKVQGSPIKISEMLATLDGAAYIERVSSHDVMHLQKAKKAIRKAFEVQKSGGGFSLIEVLSTCPTGWGIDAYEALNWIKTDMIPVYPLGVYKDSTKETK
ncbi:MAG: thiamine pyrophosphate protein domain protein TPP-binding protein [Bacillales bacterium]|nr:thiamine pyrophosphate protein domain protein TPP-binding protein [Bacillales bacterium]